MKKILLTLSLLSISLCSANAEEVLQDFSAKYKIAEQAKKTANTASIFTRNKALKKRVDAQKEFNDAAVALTHELEAIEARAKELSKTTNPAKKMSLAHHALSDMDFLTRVTDELQKATDFATSTVALSVQLHSTNEAIHQAVVSLRE